MNKKILLLIGSIIAATIALYFIQADEEIITDEFVTFTKVKEKISPAKTTDKDLKIIGVKENTPTVVKRKMIGSSEDVDFTPLNNVSEQWKPNLLKNLFSFQAKDTKVLVKHSNSYLMIKDNKGRYLEEIIVTYINSDGRVNGFTALVDSETGKIIRTWNKIINMNIHNKKHNHD